MAAVWLQNKTRYHLFKVQDETSYFSNTKLLQVILIFVQIRGMEVQWDNRVGVVAKPVGKLREKMHSKHAKKPHEMMTLPQKTRMECEFGGFPATYSKTEPSVPIGEKDSIEMLWKNIEQATECPFMIVCCFTGEAEPRLSDGNLFRRHPENALKLARVGVNVKVKNPTFICRFQWGSKFACEFDSHVDSPVDSAIDSDTYSPRPSTKDGRRFKESTWELLRELTSESISLKRALTSPNVKAIGARVIQLQFGGLWRILSPIYLSAALIRTTGTMNQLPRLEVSQVSFAAADFFFPGIGLQLDSLKQACPMVIIYKLVGGLRPTCVLNLIMGD
ncbi:hypothetical protein C8R45DRAFT_944691 [Mycena sanguinolenta]|nr:hypothetical protein C8R45DRAFT_947410 [Mycena sanguinolenta]KAJ6454436.1 hypothetical protein C8R45DRAFT_944691 [Mycena sanguinolenta]